MLVFLLGSYLNYSTWLVDGRTGSEQENQNRHVHDYLK